MRTEIDRFVKNLKLVKFVLRVMEQPDKTIKLERQPQNPRGYHYPLAEEYLGADADETLEQLADNALLEREFVAKEFGCPQCKSINLSLRLHCPNCDSTNIARQDILEHLACGFQGPKAKYVDNNCPKCGQPLGQVGVDFVRQGSQYVCGECGQVFQNAIQKLSCPRDNTNFSVDSAPEISLNNYRLTAGFEEAINRTVNQQEYIQKKIEALGFKVNSPAQLKGRSGINQQFFMMASAGLGFMKTRIIIEVIDGQTVEDVFSLYARAIDVSAYGVLFAAIPSLSDDAKRVADSYGMVYVDAPSFSAAAERLVNKFAQLVEAPEERVLEIFGGLGGKEPPKAA